MLAVRKIGGDGFTALELRKQYQNERVKFKIWCFHCDVRLSGRNVFKFDGEPRKRDPSFRVYHHLRERHAEHCQFNPIARPDRPADKKFAYETHEQGLPSEFLERKAVSLNARGSLASTSPGVFEGIEAPGLTSRKRPHRATHPRCNNTRDTVRLREEEREKARLEVKKTKADKSAASAIYNRYLAPPLVLDGRKLTWKTAFHDLMHPVARGRRFYHFCCSSIETTEFGMRLRAMRTAVMYDKSCQVPVTVDIDMRDHGRAVSRPMWEGHLENLRRLSSLPPERVEFFVLHEINNASDCQISLSDCDDMRFHLLAREWSHREKTSYYEDLRRGVPIVAGTGEQHDEIDKDQAVDDDFVDDIKGDTGQDNNETQPQSAAPSIPQPLQPLGSTPVAKFAAERASPGPIRVTRDVELSPASSASSSLAHQEREVPAFGPPPPPAKNGGILDWFASLFQ